MRGKCVPGADITGPVPLAPREPSHGCPAQQLCAPTENIDPNVPPQTCASDNGRGVCVSNCLEFDLIESIILDQGSCRSDQTCIPCINPSNGQPSGAPGC